MIRKMHDKLLHTQKLFSGPAMRRQGSRRCRCAPASLLPVADVAGSCGFNDPNYFSRVFARIVGIPPSEYRRRFLDIETRQPPPQAR